MSLKLFLGLFLLITGVLISTAAVPGKLDPSFGTVKWRHGVESRFQLNAQRCHQEAARLTDPAEKTYALNLAELWGQLAEAARSRPGVMSARAARQRRG